MKKHLLILAISILLSSSVALAQFGGMMNKAKSISEKSSKPKQTKEEETTKETDDSETPKAKKTTKVGGSYVSDFHKTHKGEILFCKATKPDVKTDQEFVAEFSVDENVTGCVYLKPISAWSQKIKGKFFIDDAAAGTFQDQLTEHLSAFSIRVLRNNFGTTESNEFVNKVLKLKGGTYKIRVEIWGSDDGLTEDEKIIATGEFSLSKVVKEEASKGTFTSFKNAGMKNLALEQKAIMLVNQKGANENWKESYKKAKIISTDWEIVKNQYTGEIICRKIQMQLYGIFPDGKCKSVGFGFKQDYAGGGKYSNLQYDGIGDMYRVDCE